MLLGLGTIGVASAGAGLGTTAYFSDTESFSGNSLQAGSLDLRVEYESSYDSGGAVENMAETISGVVDGEPAGMFYDLRDVKPGDSGSFEFCFEIEDNPSYMWACGMLEQAENGITEPEAAVDDDDEGELAESIMATLSYCTEDGETLNVIAEDVTLFDAFALLVSGVPLDGAAPAGFTEPGEQAPYAEEDEETGFITGPCLCVDWVLPTDVGNEIQSDSLTFGMEFHALQARHNDGTVNPCTPTITTRTGEGFGKVEENFNDGGTENSFARARFGDNLNAGAWELAVGQTVQDSTKGQLDWTGFLGDEVPFRLIYDGADGLTFELGDENAPLRSISYSGIAVPNGKIVVTNKSDEATAAVSDLALSLDGTEVTLSGPTSLTSTNDDATGSDDGGRDVRYLVFDTTASDLANGFVLSGDALVNIQGDFPGGDEDLAISISLE